MTQNNAPESVAAEGTVAGQQTDTTKPETSSQPAPEPPSQVTTDCPPNNKPNDVPATEPASSSPRPTEPPAPPPPKPTIALSPLDIATLTFPDGTRGTFPAPPQTSAQSASTPSIASGHVTPQRDTDTASITSVAGTLRGVTGTAGDLASLLAGDGLGRKSKAWRVLRAQQQACGEGSGEEGEITEIEGLGLGEGMEGFEREFDNIPDTLPDDERLALWKGKLKHYLILSSAGKPIWSRHGDLSLVNSTMGVVQTIISFYEGARNPLLGFTAGKVRFVILIKGPLYFVAISRLRESDAQLRAQLEALYMQILSTLTLPILTNIFAHRPSTDLRGPLQGTESLLASLADSFTKGSPSTLLSALECLRLRKSQRQAITNIFLKSRCEELLYGLLVAGGKLVSVIRPRKHSLHPSDLQLIFNMLFESGGIKGNGGENWIPLCLPAFNNTGYLYMYVSFLDDKAPDDQNQPPESSNLDASNKNSSNTPDDDLTALILISPSREAFYALQSMRTRLVSQLLSTGYLSLIRSTALSGRPSITSILPKTPLLHFLYKSRPNVQWCMSSLSSLTPPGATATETLLARRKLMSVYEELHAALHARHAHLRVVYSTADEKEGEGLACLGWSTPAFEVYCVAPGCVGRAGMAREVNRVVQWARREEERLFILGGGVF